MKDKFCSNCGSSDRSANYPKKCFTCHNVAYKNPLPVAVVVQPVLSYNGVVGLAMARRAIEPKLGSWALLGGHLEDGETFEEAAIREFREETSGLITRVAPAGITGSYANGRGHVLVAVEMASMTEDTWRTAKLCPENSEFDVMWEHTAYLTELGFPIHQWVADAFFRDWHDR